MPGNDKATARTVVVIVLLVLAAAALRGYLPGVEQAPRERPTGGPATLIAVVAMLGVSMAIIAISIITQARRPAAAKESAGDLPRDLAGERARFTWRLLLVMVGAVVVWLLMVLLLMRLGTQLEIADPPPSGTGSTTAPGGDGADPPPEPQPDSGSNVFEYLAAATVLLFVLCIGGTVVASRRRRPVAFPPAPDGDGDPSSPLASGPESLARAAELGLAEIGDLSREPREAIIACYTAMERELEKAPGTMPLDSDTPSEVLARAVEHRALHAESATELVDLFEEARFSPHVMNEGHREVAVRALRLVLRELETA